MQLLEKSPQGIFNNFSQLQLHASMGSNLECNDLEGNGIFEGSFFLTVGAVLLAVELLCFEPIQVLTRGTLPLQAKQASIVSTKAPIVSKTASVVSKEAPIVSTKAPKHHFSCFLSVQKNSRRLWRSRRRKSSSVPAGAANFPAAVFLAGKCPNLGRYSMSRCRKICEEFSSSVEICRKTFPAGIFGQPQPSRVF